jgi:hypothetical protein
MADFFSMASVVRRLVLVLTVIVAFTALQTGWARACDCGDEHPDEEQPCSEGGEETPCAPTCIDCTGCGGPARALIGNRDPVLMAACCPVVLGTPVVERAVERAPDRIDRPPRG